MKDPSTGRSRCEFKIVLHVENSLEGSGLLRLPIHAIVMKLCKAAHTC